MEFSVYTDCLELIDQFIKVGIPTFSSFCEQWKKMQFQDIFLVQPNHIEVINTTQAIFHVSKRTICGRNVNGVLLRNSNFDDSNENHLRRIGALYLMYAIYFKQPTKQLVKITLSMNTWKEIEEFFLTISPTEEIGQQIRYILMLMIKENAFQFSALDHNVGLENLINYDMVQMDLPKKDMPNSFNSTQLNKELVTVKTVHQLLPAMCKLEENYNSLKSRLCEQKSLNFGPESIAKTNIFQKLKSTFDNIQKILDETSSKKQSKENVLDLSDDSDEEISKRQNPSRKSQTMCALQIGGEEASADTENMTTSEVQNSSTGSKVQYTSLAMLLEDVIEELDETSTGKH